MAEVLIDTDVLIDHLRGARALEPGDGGLACSVVTRCELFAGRRVDEDGVRRLLADFSEIPVDRQVAEQAGRIRRAAGLRTPDALIAATALAAGLTLVTRNARDFDRVPGLEVRPPA